MWDLSKLSCSQFVYCHWYRFCCGSYYWCLGDYCGYCGGGCSCSWGVRFRLGQYPYLILSFGYHGSSSLVRDICFGSWGFLDSGVGAWLGWSQLVLLWMTLLWLGLLQLGLGLRPGLGIKYHFQFHVCFNLPKWGRGKDGALYSRDYTWLPGMSYPF